MDSKTTEKAIKAGETLDQFLDPAVTAIGSREEEAAVLVMRKLPSGMDEKKIHDAIMKMGALKIFRFSSSFSKEYIHVLKAAMNILVKDTFQSRMMTQCLFFALDQDFEEPQAYTNFTETATFLQYLDTFQFPVEKADGFAKSDKLITAAVAENAGKTLLAVQYNSRDIRVLNSFMYALGKSDLPMVEAAAKFQIESGGSYELNVVIKALQPNSELPNTSKAYQWAVERLTAIQEKNLAFKLAGTIGLEPVFDTPWSFKIQVSSDPTEKTPRKGWFVITEIAGHWNDPLAITIRGPKGDVKGNERHGVLMGKGLGFKKIDLFNLRPDLDEAASLYGIEKLYWENAAISVTGLDKKSAKTIKDWLLAF